MRNKGIGQKGSGERRMDGTRLGNKNERGEKKKEVKLD